MKNIVPDAQVPSAITSEYFRAKIQEGIGQVKECITQAMLLREHVPEGEVKAALGLVAAIQNRGELVPDVITCYADIVLLIDKINTRIARLIEDNKETLTPETLRIVTDSLGKIITNQVNGFRMDLALANSNDDSFASLDTTATPSNKIPLRSRVNKRRGRPESADAKQTGEGSEDGTSGLIQENKSPAIIETNEREDESKLNDLYLRIARLLNYLNSVEVEKENMVLYLRETPEERQMRERERLQDYSSQVQSTTKLLMAVGNCLPASEPPPQTDEKTETSYIQSIFEFDRLKCEWITLSGKNWQPSIAGRPAHVAEDSGNDIPERDLSYGDELIKTNRAIEKLEQKMRDAFRGAVEKAQLLFVSVAKFVNQLEAVYRHYSDASIAALILELQKIEESLCALLCDAERPQMPTESSEIDMLSFGKVCNKYKKDAEKVKAMMIKANETCRPLAEKLEELERSKATIESIMELQASAC